LDDVDEPIRVLVADDHPLYRSSVVRAIRQHPRLELVGEADDGHRTLDAIRAQRPDVAVIDLQMPGVDGNTVIDVVRLEGLPTRVLLLSGALDSGSTYRALEQGAAGVLSKLVDVPALLDAILAVARGEAVIAEEAQSAVVAEIRLRSEDDRPVLTPREREILGLMADGDSVPAMAKALHLSQSTIKSHVEHLYRKLGVSDRAAAVATAMRRGLLH
jgi:two-component system nitrate/nitrite response regulator NarL